jgi:YHS domain-containing protein
MTIQTNKHQLIDPVCHMNVAKSSTVPSFSYRDDIYYFCADACREAFMADPDKYLGAEAPKKKGIWGRYLDRLNKSTGGKPQCCH